jgi:polyhydroxyalkanoate synthesis regulator phasin
MEQDGSGGNQDRRSTSRRMKEGLKEGIGVLAAFKDALEETIQEARERGDFSAERAKGVMKGALDRAQAAASGAKEKLDFVNQGEMEALTTQIEGLEARVAALETHVFGGERAPSAPPNTPDGGTSAP